MYSESFLWTCIGKYDIILQVQAFATVFYAVDHVPKIVSSKIEQITNYYTESLTKIFV